MTHWFGKEFTREYIPVEDGVYSPLPTQSPVIHIFNTEPSRATAIAGTGALQTIATWTQSAAEPYACLYSIGAIADPAPTQQVLNSTQRQVWEAINFATEDAGASQCVVRAFDMERPLGLSSTPGVSVADIKEAYPAISNYLNDSQIADFLPMAEMEFRLELEAKGYQWAKLTDLKRAWLPLAYKTVVLCAASQVREPTDKHAWRVDFFTQRYTAVMSGITFGYDEDDNGAADTEAKAVKSYLMVQK